MREMFYYGCSMLYMIVKVIMTLMVSSALFEPKTEKRTRILWWAAAAAGIGGLDTLNQIVTEILFSNYLMFLEILLLCFVIAGLYRCRLGQAGVVVWFLWMWQTMLDFFLQSFFYMALQNQGTVRTWLLVVGPARGVYLLLWGLLLFWAGIKLKTWILQRQDGFHRRWYYFYLALPVLILIMIYFQRIYNQYYSEELMLHWCIFLLGLTSAALFAIVYRIRKQAETQLLIQRTRLELLQKNYQMLLEEDRQKAILLHDLSRCNAVIREIAFSEEKDESEKALLLHTSEKVAQILERSRAKRISNHPLLDLILNQKLSEAEKEGIEVQYSCQDMSGLQMSDMDICALFVNLLDNAIEANQKLPPERERCICLQAKKKGRMAIVAVSNPYDGVIRYRDEGIPETTKADKKAHGYGLQSIRQTVEKYRGHMEIKTENGNFEIVMYLEGFGDE